LESDNRNCPESDDGTSDSAALVVSTCLSKLTVVQVTFAESTLIVGIFSLVKIIQENYRKF